jgi:hypothetical protein
VPHKKAFVQSLRTKALLVITVDRGIPAHNQSLSPFSPNIVPAPESHRSVAALVPFIGVVARLYPVRTVIQLSIEAVLIRFFVQIEKAEACLCAVLSTG